MPAGEWDQPFDLHAIMVFLRDGKRVFHTYSTYVCGTAAAAFATASVGRWWPAAAGW